MKKLFFTLLTGLGLVASAQVPQATNYQAVARNAQGVALVNQPVRVRFTVHDQTITGTTVYQETDTATTNQFGLFTAVIGNGVAVTGTFAGIAWGTGSKFLQVEIDPTGGVTYVDAGTNQLLSVPYAQVANSLASNVSFSVQNNSTFSIGSRDSAQMPFNVVITNDGNGWSNNAFTVPVAGLYQFNLQVTVATVMAAGGYIIYEMEQNGHVLFYNVDGISNAYLNMNVSAKLNVGDVITLKIFNYVSTGMQFADGYGPDTYFSGYKVY